MFDRPTLQTLVDRVRADMLARMMVDDTLRRADAEVYARVMSAAAHSLYGFIDYVSRQILPDTADGDWLDRHASLWLTQPRKPASAATGTATFTGTNGAVVPVGAVLQALDGTQFATTAGGTVAAGVLVLAIQASAGGAAGNRSAGEPLGLVSPIAGVQATATAGEVSGGADVETDDALRARVLARIRQAPHGGAAADYTTWALEVPGVTRAWVYPEWDQPGSVALTFVRDDDASPIPDAGEVATVQTYVDARRPVTADLTVFAPTAVPLNLTIDLVPDTAEVRAAVAAELADFIRREAEPGGTIYRSRLVEAISSAAGEAHHILSVPAADVAHGYGQMPTLGAITWL